MTLTFLISTLVFVSHIAFVIVAALILLKVRRVKAFFHANALRFSLLITASVVAGSMFFSNVLGWEPCELCWYQRILLFPQVVLFGIATWRNDRSIFLYTVPLSVIGGLIALYHALLPYFPSASFCDATVSCTKLFTMDYGYITIPVMSLTAFVLLLGLAWVGKKQV